MSHTFSIASAKFNQTQITPNPKITYTGSVDSLPYVFTTSWNQVMYAQSSGGTDAVKAVLQALMLNSMVIYKQLLDGSTQVEVPKYSTSASIPTPAFDRNGGWVDVQEILDCGTWTA